MARKPNLEAREHILEAALGLFHERGYRGVSMEDVAEKAGLKKANLFHYYPTKDDLGAAVVDRATTCLRAEVQARFADGKDPIRTVERLFAESAARMEAGGCSRGCFMGNLAQEISDGNERLRLKVSDYLDFWVERLADYLRRHRDAGYFRKELQPRQSAEAVLSLLEGALLFCKANKRVDALKNARVMAAAYLEGLKA